MTVQLLPARIPMRDGIELAVTLYLPEGVSGPVPALLEYLPYRKDDAMAARDYELYSYLARRGYAGARVDIRGTGASDGERPGGEYTEQEQRDAEDVIAWLAAQPWCSGAVGMWGISWGGFNAIQVALRRPSALKAIIAVDASDDLFHDDVHYIDGLLHIDEYALMIDHINALPPAPDFSVDEHTLTRRFDSPPWLATWLGQQRDGPYWRRGSLRPDYGRLTLPAFLIGGWLDGYRDSVPRMLARVPAPVKALIGPWNHSFPHNAAPGPKIEWRAEAVRWWDHWLKGADNESWTSRPSPFTCGTGTRRTSAWPRYLGGGGQRRHCRPSEPSTGCGIAARNGTCLPHRRRTGPCHCGTCRRRGAGGQLVGRAHYRPA